MRGETILNLGRKNNSVGDMENAKAEQTRMKTREVDELILAIANGFSPLQWYFDHEEEISDSVMDKLEGKLKTKG